MFSFLNYICRGKAPSLQRETKDSNPFLKIELLKWNYQHKENSHYDTYRSNTNMHQKVVCYTRNSIKKRVLVFLFIPLFKCFYLNIFLCKCSLCIPRKYRRHRTHFAYFHLFRPFSLRVTCYYQCNHTPIARHWQVGTLLFPKLYSCSWNAYSALFLSSTNKRRQFL